MAGSMRNTAWAAVNVRPAAPPACPEQDKVKQETTPPQKDTLQHLTLACPSKAGTFEKSLSLTHCR